MSRSAPSPFTLAETMAFAMIGAAVELHRRVPHVLQTQRTKWDQQVTLARFLGQMVVSQAQQELRRRVTAASVGSSAAAPRTTATSDDAATPSPAPSTPSAERAGGGRGPTVAELPIDHYDELSASQVIERLTHLDAHELDAVHQYESQHRRRRTVLGRLDQLRTTPQV